MKVKARSTHSAGADFATVGAPYLPGQVNFENYTERALNFVRSSGRDNGSHPVVRMKDAEPGPFFAWLAYLIDLRPEHKRAGFEQMARSLGSLSVPMEWPWDFSLDADWVRERLAEILRQEGKGSDRLVSAERRQELSAFMRSQHAPSMRQASRPRFKARDDVPMMSSELAAKIASRYAP